MQLTSQDINDLIDAVEAWEHADQAGEMMGDLLGAMMVRDDAELKAKMERERAAQQRARDQKKRLRKERSIVLRAKLLTIRDGQDADEFLESMKGAS